MRITLATLGMAPADYVTKCDVCLDKLSKRYDEIYHVSGMCGFKSNLTLCRACAASEALDYLAQLTASEAHEATTRIIHETRSH